MCGSLLAPKPPSMPAPPAAPVEQDEPIFQAGNEADDEVYTTDTRQGRSQLKNFNTTDTGLAIPL